MGARDQRETAERHQRQPPPPANNIVTLENYADPAFIAARAGYKVGCSIVERIEGANQVFYIVAFPDDRTVRIISKSGYDASIEIKTASVMLDNLMSSWSVVKSENPLNTTNHQTCPRWMDVDGA